MLPENYIDIKRDSMQDSYTRRADGRNRFRNNLI